VRLRERPTPVLLGVGAVTVVLVGAAAALSRDDPADAFILGAVAVAAAVAVLLLPRVEPAYPITAGIVLSVFSGNWGAMGIPIGLDRPILLYGVAAVGVRLLPDAPNRLRLRVTWVHWLLAGVAIYAIGSALFAATLTEREPFYGMLDRLAINGFLLFLVAPAAFATRESRDVLLKGLIALGAYLGVIAIFEASGLTGLIVPPYIADPSYGIHFGRARGPFVEAGADGLAMYVCLVAAAVGLARWRGAARLACAAVVALCAVGVVLTITRQVWLGAGVATVVTLLVAPQLRRFVVPVVVLGVITVLGVFAAFPGLQEKADDRANARLPVLDRLNSDRAALAMIDRKPLLGFGWYRFGADSAPFYRQASSYQLTTPVSRPHNVFLANAAELGLLGGTLWLIALLAAIGGAVVGRAPPELEPWRIGMIAVAVNWVVIANFTPLGQTFGNVVLWLWAGVVWARHPAVSGVRVRVGAPAPVRGSPVAAVAAGWAVWTHRELPPGPAPDDARLTS